MTRSWLLAAGCAACLAFVAGDGARAADAVKLAARTGAVMTPKNFPKHGAEEVTDMFRQGAELGSFAIVRINWNDEKRSDAMRALVALAHQAGLAPVVELNPLKADELKGASVDPPKDVAAAAGRRVSFANPAVAEPFIKAVLEFAELKPPYLAVATDVNLLALSDPGEYAALAAVYARLYPRIKEISPDTRVFVTFQWEALQRLDRAAGRRLVDTFRPGLDVLAVSSDPRRLFEKQGPAGIPADYYARLSGYASGREQVFVELGWPSDGGSGEADQVSFVRQVPYLTSSLRPSMVAWTFLHDVRVLIFTLRAGLIAADGTRKPAFAAFKEITGDRPAAAAVAAAAAPLPSRLPRGRTLPASREPAHFGIYTARLDGSDFRVLLSSPDQEMTHPRVSPDGTRIVLTRYHARGKDGKASEEQGYENTEILVMNLDGTGLETIVPPKPGIIAANGCWTPDGKSLIWLSTDNPQRSPEIRQIDLATREVTRVPTPPGLKTTDPHWEAGKLVFPAKADGKGADALWLMNADGSGARQVTRPRRTGILPGLYGDFDPKLSPDGSKVAFMRIDGGEGWRVMVLDLATGEERLLTPKGVIQWLPTWSSDAKRLLYVHVDRDKPREIGLYTMTPDGNDRRMVPLPRGRLYGHSSFFPADGSSDRARIIFNGTVKPGL